MVHNVSTSDNMIGYNSVIRQNFPNDVRNKNELFLTWKSNISQARPSSTNEVGAPDTYPFLSVTTRDDERHRP